MSKAPDNKTILTARLLKKRETDRKCQQMIRERNKSRIEHLEGLVRELRQRDASGRTDVLLRLIDENVASKDVLARKISEIKRIIDNEGKPLSHTQKSSTPLTSSTSLSQHAKDNSNPHAQRINTIAHDFLISNKDPSRQCDLSIRAIVEGWDTIEQYTNAHPVWPWLRLIDETCLAPAQSYERLAILIVLSISIESFFNPSKSQGLLGPRYLQRSTQDLLQLYQTKGSGRATTYRRSGQKYCSCQFWCSFRKSFKFVWPYETRDCYVRNVESGSYAISTTFWSYINDSQCWEIGQEFFHIYPELQDVNMVQMPNIIPSSDQMSESMDSRYSSGVPQQVGPGDIHPHHNLSHAHNNNSSQTTMQSAPQPVSFGSVVVPQNAYDTYPTGFATYVAGTHSTTFMNRWSDWNIIDEQQSRAT